MKIVIANYAWNHLGGATLVCAYAAKVFLDKGFDVIAVSLTNFNKNEYLEEYGIDLKNIKIYSLISRDPSALGLYYRLVYWIPLKKAIKKEKPQALFTDVELYKPVLKLKKKINFKILEYIHFPYAVEKDKLHELPKEYIKALNEYLGELKNQYKKYEKRPWKYYYKLWLKLYKKVARENPFYYADIVMSNSRYTAKLSKILWSKEPTVLNPPVKTKDFTKYSAKSIDQRENAVVMISRISPEKRIEEAIDAIALTKTKPLLRVIGRISPYNIKYKKYLERKAKEKNIKIEFHCNVPREKLAELIAKSKIFIHTTRGEHFGIAVVEAMAAGLPVIVHKSGGPYEDIIDYGKYGMFYENLVDLSQKIDELLKNSKLWTEYHKKSIERAKIFDEKNFSEKLIRITEKILSN